MWVVNTCQQHPFAEKSFFHDFFWIETPEKFETETAPSFLDSLHLEEAESNTFESDAAWKYPQGAPSDLQIKSRRAASLIFFSWKKMESPLFLAN